MCVCVEYGVVNTGVRWKREGEKETKEGGNDERMRICATETGSGLQGREFPPLEVAIVIQLPCFCGRRGPPCTQ